MTRIAGLLRWLASHDPFDTRRAVVNASRAAEQRRFEERAVDALAARLAARVVAHAA